MDGIRGLNGWSWIFILEGIVTALFGIASFWVVHDFPDEATFLTPEDRARVIRRLKMDQQSSAEHEEFKMKYVWMAVKDYKMWLGMVIYMVSSTIRDKWCVWYISGTVTVSNS